MSVFEQPQEESGSSEQSATYEHLREAAQELGLDTNLSQWSSAGMAADQLAAINSDLQNAIKNEFVKRAFKGGPLRPICKIGPYAHGLCTICGLRQP